MKKLILISLILTLSSCMVSSKLYDEQVNINNNLLQDLQIATEVSKEQDLKCKTLTEQLEIKRKCCEIKNDTLEIKKDTIK
tara:strand:- start:1207 stop:1449 length:243 start_codon:yes stop_codon:yes gene_type:complete